MSRAAPTQSVPTAQPAPKAALIQTGQIEDWSQPSVVFFAAFIAVLVLTAGYGIDRAGWVDELGFQNPPYMLAHFGRLTFPSFVSNWFFDLPVITHPPIHTFLIGSLCRFGFSIYYAEATPTVLLFLLAIICIVRGAFSAPVKLGLLFSIGFLMAAANSMPFTELFGSRPEGHLHAAWFCGLMLLESGRLDNWDCRKLAAGSFLLTWASGVHYYAAFAFLGVMVYLVAVVRALDWKAAKPRVLALAMGACLFGVPYLVLYIWPYRKEIQACISDMPGQVGIGGAIRWHTEAYRSWATFGRHLWPLRTAMSWGVPLLVYTTAILVWVRQTRAVALAAMPLQVFLYLFAWHKLSPYLVHEVALCAAALAIGGMVLLDAAAKQFLSGMARQIVIPAATAMMTVFLAAGSPMLEAASFSAAPRIHEAEVARAAARDILGPNARVGANWGQWYVSGGDHFYDTEPDIQWGVTGLDPLTYASNFDAMVECPNFCVGKGAHSASGWYADGTLKLRGFFFGETDNDQLRFLLLSAAAPERVVGYASRNGQLYRFREESGGDYSVISGVCPVSPDVGLTEYAWYRNWPAVFQTVLRIPEDSPDASRVIVTILAPQTIPEPAGWVSRTCRTVSRASGTLALVDRRAMVQQLRNTDRPIRFYRGLDKMPGYSRAGIPATEVPPSDAKCVDVIDLAHTTAINGARLEAGIGPKLTMRDHAGGYYGSIPIHDAASLIGPGWIQLKLLVLSGRIGFHAEDTNDRILATSLGIWSSKDVQTIAARAADLRGAAQIILTNEDSNPAEVVVLDATILAAR